MNRYRRVEVQVSREETLRRFLDGEFAPPESRISNLKSRPFWPLAKVLLAALGLGAAAGAVPLFLWWLS